MCRIVCDFSGMLMSSGHTNISGPFAEALDLMRLFGGKGPVVQIFEADEPVTSYESEDPVDPEFCWKKPLVIICDRKTSGSAEVFCAAIQDYQRGIVIGGTGTHGRGTVQNVFDVKERTSLFIPSYGSVKATVTAIFRVTGNGIQHAGVNSDILLPSLSEVLNPGEESLENTTFSS
jgi:carboxyl-terminal processing protease